MNKKTKGVLTVEAALIFPIFIIFFAFILNFLNIFYAHTIMQSAISNISRKISEVYYISVVTKAEDKFVAMIDEGREKKKGIIDNSDNLIKSLTEVVNVIIPEGGADVDVINYINNLTTLQKKSEIFLNDINTLKVNLEDNFPDYLLSILMSEATTKVGDSIMNALLKTYLNDMGYDIDKNIENMNAHILFKDGENKDITITVIYEYKNNFAIKFFDKLPMINTVTVHPWVGGRYAGETNDK